MTGKSKEEIAFELVSKLRGVGVWGENNMQEILNMYAECLEATSGLRTLEGREPSALQLAKAGAPKTSVPRKAAAPAGVPQQPVHQQQQRVQQAFQQQVQQQR